MRSASLWLVLPLLVAGHGDHTFDLNDADDGMTYAERHMHTEHHIDSFDLPSFFSLHDLDLDGFWDEAEIQAVYGVHHHSVKGKLPEQLVDGRAEVVVKKVLDKLDADKDGRISEAEFLAGGKEGLPTFEGYRDLGHHYDEESEYFLHHEELYHSTPETQTDESYNHPEDIEHFKHHAEIEDEEDARERQFEGLPPDADLSADHVVQDPLDEHAHAPGEGPPAVTGAGGDDAQQVLQAGDAVPSRPLRRVTPGAAPNRIKESAMKQADQEEWQRAGDKVRGQPRQGHGAPRSAEERLKVGVPYKYKSVSLQVDERIAIQEQGGKT